MAIEVSHVAAGFVPVQGAEPRREAVRDPAEEARQATAEAALALEEARKASAEAAPDIGVVLRELARVSIAFDRRLQFSLNEKLGQVVVKVIDGETDKVIKEIPPAEIQHVHERIREVIGILFDERA